MSWASIYWDLDHIVQAAREAMESAYAAEMAARSTSIEKPLIPDLNVESTDAGADALKTVEAAITSLVDSSVQDSTQPEKITNTHESSPTESLIKARVLDTQINFQPRSPWTTEIETALREFLRPLSVNLRYEYRVPDTLDEKRSITAMNSLFKQRAKPEDSRVQDISARNESRRKKSRGRVDPQRSVPQQSSRSNDTSGL